MSAAASTRREIVLGSITVVVCVIAATWLRLHGIADKSFWTDEGISAAFTKLGWYDFARILWRREGNMTLYYLLLRAWSHLGDSVAMIRGLSVLCSVATIPVLYLLGRRLFNDWTARAAVILFTVNAYSVRYAQEARSYSLVALLVTVASLFFVKAIQHEDERSWRWYIVFSVLAIYAHFFALLVVIAHGVFAWRAAHKHAFVRAAKRIALFTIPIWIFIATTGTGPIGWIPRPRPDWLWFAAQHYSGNDGAILFAPMGVCLIAAGVIAISAYRLKDITSPYLLLAWWWLIPWIITLPIAMIKPVFLPRYLIITLPAVVLFAAAGLNQLRRAYVAVPLIVAIAWFSIAGVRSFYAHDFDISREDFRGATAYILSHAQPGDAIVFHKAQNRFAYEYYADHSSAAVKPSIIYPGSNQPTWKDFVIRVTPATVESVRQQKSRVWILMSENLGPRGEDDAAEQLKQAAAAAHKNARQKDFEVLRVYLFGD
jgi:mannosyltransferase